MCLFNISHFSSTNCSDVMSKRTQKDSGEERVTAKSKPMMNLVSRCRERTPDVLAATASESPEKTRYESQLPLSLWNEQHQRTGRPVLDAYSSNYSEWNADKNWSSQDVKSTSPVTENHDKNGYVFQDNNKNFIMTNVDNSDTTYTNKNDTNNHNTHDLHK